MSDDAELLRRYAEEKSEAAFAEFVERHLGMVYASALRRLGNAHAAADVAQRVFIAVAERAAPLAGHPTIAGWLFAASRNASLDLMKAEQRRRAREWAAQADEALLRDAGNDPGPADWGAVRLLIDDALERLAIADREAVLLRCVEGRSFQEVGRRLQLSENAARMRVERALEKLRGLLSKRGVDSTASALGLALAQEAAAVPAGLAASVTGAAVATAAAAVGAWAPAAGFFAIMNTTKLAIGVAAAIGLTGVGTGVYQATEAARSRAELMRRDAALAEAQTRLTEAQVRLARMEATAKEPAEPGARLNPAPPTAPARRPAAAVARAGVVEEKATDSGARPANLGMEYWGTPEYPQLAMQKHRAEIGLRFAPLYRALGLTPAQVATFETNRLAMEQAMVDVYCSAVAKGVSIDSPAVRQLIVEAGQPLERELSTLLGKDGYKEFTRFRSAKSALDFTATVAGSLYPVAPLTREQGDLLTRAAQDSVRSVPATGNSGTRRMEMDWTAFAQAAERALSPEQLPTLKALLASRELQQQINALQTALRRSAAGAAAKP